MTGYRLGWIIGDKGFINQIRNLSMNFYLSPSSISQYVAKKYLIIMIILILLS